MKTHLYCTGRVERAQGGPKVQRDVVAGLALVLERWSWRYSLLFHDFQRGFGTRYKLDSLFLVNAVPHSASLWLQLKLVGLSVGPARRNHSGPIAYVCEWPGAAVELVVSRVYAARPARAPGRFA